MATRLNERRDLGRADGPARPILLVPHRGLRAKARVVTAADRARVASLLPAMFRTMYDAPGIGLAAPQIGVDLRVVVVDVGDDAPEPLALVNPVILQEDGDAVLREEGCLSLPGIYAEISRPARVTVAFEDASGAPREVAADGMLARCLQHEIDHLDGILFVDRLSALKRGMLLRRFAKEGKDGRKPSRAAAGA